MSTIADGENIQGMSGTDRTLAVVSGVSEGIKDRRNWPECGQRSDSGGQGIAGQPASRVWMDGQIDGWLRGWMENMDK